MYIMHNKCGNFGEGRALPPLLQGNFYVRRMYKYTVLRGLFYNSAAAGCEPCTGGAGKRTSLAKMEGKNRRRLTKNARRAQKKRLPTKGAAFLRSSPQYFLFYSSFSAAAISPTAAAAAAREISLPVNILFVLMGLSFLRLPPYPKSFEKKPFFSGIAPLSIDFTS